MYKKLKKWFRELFWVTCPYCGEKKPYFYYTFECNIQRTPDYIEGTLEICTSCAEPYFDI